MPIESRLIREIRERQDAEGALTEFVALLLDALDVPEVRDAVRAALGVRAPLIPPAQPAPPARGVARRRGR